MKKDINLISKKDKLFLIDSCYGKYDLYLYKASLFRLFPISGHTFKCSFRKIIRFVLMFFNGYRIYLMADKNKKVLASACFTNGKLKRYPFASEKDIILGPYFVIPEMRGFGLATLFLTFLLNKYEIPSGNLYGHVLADNYPSIRVLEKLGFKKEGRYISKRLSGKLVKRINGNLVLFKR